MIYLRMLSVQPKQYSHFFGSNHLPIINRSSCTNFKKHLIHQITYLDSLAFLYLLFLTFQKLYDNIIFSIEDSKAMFQQSAQNDFSHSKSEGNSSFDQCQDKSIQRTSQFSLKELRKSKQRIISFLQSLGHLKDTKIRQDIAQNCYFGQRKIKKVDCHINYSFVLRAIDSRLQKMSKMRKLKKNWGEDDLKILVWLVSKVCELYNINNPQLQFGEQHWNIISSIIPGTSPQTCKFRWLNFHVSNLTSNSWTANQKRLLREIIEELLASGVKEKSLKDWRNISYELYNRNKKQYKCYRNAKQCKELWNCYLSPQIRKGPWTKEEDFTLLLNISQRKGNKRWCELISRLRGRTENAIKNRYNLLLEKQRKLHKHKYLSEIELVQEMLSKHRQLEIDEFDISQLGHSSNSYLSESEEMMDQKKQNEGKISSFKENAFSQKEKYQLQVQKINYKQFKEGVFSFTHLELGFLNSSDEFIRYNPNNKERTFSFDKLSENNHLSQSQCCIAESFSFVFEDCFN